MAPFWFGSLLPWARTAMLAGLLLLACAIVFRPAMRGDWLWQDEEKVLTNPAVQETGETWSRIWAASDATGFAPLYTTVLRVQWQLLGENPRGYHAVSLALHTLNALLLWLLLQRLGARGAWLAAMLFAVHPSVVQVVAWVSAQQHAAALCFLLLSAIAWVEYSRRPRSAGLLQFAALLAFAAALLCHRAVALFPFWLLLHAWWRGDLTRGRIWSAVLTFFGVMVAFMLVRAAVAPADVPASAMASDATWLERVLNSGRIVLFYLTKGLWPSGTLPVYPRWPVHAAWFLGWLPIMAIVVVGWMQRHGWGRHLLLGFGFFLTGVLPLLGIPDSSWMQVTWVADRELYILLPGILALIAATAATFLTRTAAIMRFTTAGVILLGILVFAVKSRGQTRIYRDPTSFWLVVRDAHPEQSLAHRKLGELLGREYRWPDAIRSLQHTVELAPQDADSRWTLARTLFDAGRIREAITQLETVIALQPGDAAAHARLGEAFMRLGEFSQAVAPLETATGLEPTNARAHDFLATALLHIGREADGLLHLAHSQRLQPDHLKAFRPAQAYAAAGQEAEAVQSLQEALQLYEGFAPARAMLAALQGGEG